MEIQKGTITENGRKQGPGEGKTRSSNSPCRDWDIPGKKEEFLFVAGEMVLKWEIGNSKKKGRRSEKKREKKTVNQIRQRSSWNA